MGYNQYTVPDTVAVEPITLTAFTEEEIKILQDKELLKTATPEKPDP